MEINTLWRRYLWFESMRGSHSFSTLPILKGISYQSRLADDSAWQKDRLKEVGDTGAKMGNGQENLEKANFIPIAGFGA
jgi:hypothetical protein